MNEFVVAGFPVNIFAPLASRHVFRFFTFLTHLYARRVTLFLRANLFANLSINSVKTVTCLYSKNRNVCLLLDCDICGAIWKTLDGSSLFAC